MDLLQSVDTSRLERLVGEQPRAVRYLVGRLWDPDGELRHRAAVALGAAAAAHPELGRDVLRRLVWALNDESATNGVLGLAAIGEIGARAPELVEPFIGPVASLSWDDGLRPEILRALARIADAAPELVAPVLDDLDRWVDRGRVDEAAAFEELGMRVRHGEA